MLMDRQTVSVREIQDFLENEKLYVYDLYASHSNVLSFRIENGDWKHEHLRCKLSLMEKYGALIDTIDVNPEPSDDDAYSAEYKVHFAVSLT
jgi:hypothetical protein